MGFAGAAPYRDWFLLPKMFIEPGGKMDNIPDHREPPMLAPAVDNQLHYLAQSLGEIDVSFGLVERDQRVGITMIDERGWEIAVHMVDRGTFTTNLLPVDHVR